LDGGEGVAFDAVGEVRSRPGGFDFFELGQQAQAESGEAAQAQESVEGLSQGVGQTRQPGGRELGLENFNVEGSF